MVYLVAVLIVVLIAVLIGAYVFIGSSEEDWVKKANELLKNNEEIQEALEELKRSWKEEKKEIHRKYLEQLTRKNEIIKAQNIALNDTLPQTRKELRLANQKISSLQKQIQQMMVMKAKYEVLKDLLKQGENNG